MASNKHAQIRYKVLDDCFSNFRRKFYFDDLIERCNEADKDENEIVESMSWHFEEWMEDRAFDFLTQANTDKKLLN